MVYILFCLGWFENFMVHFGPNCLRVNKILHAIAILPLHHHLTPPKSFAFCILQKYIWPKTKSNNQSNQENGKWSSARCVMTRLDQWINLIFEPNEQKKHSPDSVMSLFGWERGDEQFVKKGNDERKGNCSPPDSTFNFKTPKFEPTATNPDNPSQNSHHFPCRPTHHHHFLTINTRFHLQSSQSLPHPILSTQNSQHHQFTNPPQNTKPPSQTSPNNKNVRTWHRRLYD